MGFDLRKGMHMMMRDLDNMLEVEPESEPELAEPPGPRPKRKKGEKPEEAS